MIEYFKATAQRDDYQESKEVIKYFREDLKCSSYCFEHLFGWDWPVENGRPIGVCRDELKHEIYLVFKFPAIVAFIAAIMSGLALPTQYLLWKGYAEKYRRSAKPS
mmetsp:Transcript_719/g.1019  ORF Transcript_719/g.1019 Transcript_719/m.1019 type:complete len:106 (+) Transcript_719:1001-1318(+)